MPSIELKNVNNFICRDLNLSVVDKELLVLLGPVGAGKTTILNIITGLISYEGSILFGGEPIDGLPPNQRGVGYLFQDLNLFPHMDVAANIVYGLRVQGRSKVQVGRRLKELLTMFRIEGIAHRYPKNLSGGEKKRVALARALAPGPEILLLDEPLDGLDLKTRKYLRMEFRRIQRRMGITAIYVTHDQIEAEEMADRIAVIHNGCLQQVGTPGDVFFHPRTEEVSDFIGQPNILDCESSRILAVGLVEVKCGGVPIVVPHHGDSVRKIAIFPKDIYVSVEDPPGPDINRFKGMITEIIPAGPLTKLRIRVGRNEMISELRNDVFETLDLDQGTKVFLILKLRWIRVL